MVARQLFLLNRSPHLAVPNTELFEQVRRERLLSAAGQREADAGRPEPPGRRGRSATFYPLELVRTITLACFPASAATRSPG